MLIYARRDMEEQKAAAATATVTDMESSDSVANTHGEEGEQQQQEEAAVPLDISPFANLVASMCGGAEKKPDQVVIKPPADGGSVALNRLGHVLPFTPHVPVRYR
jgi:hypothetical protein